MNDKRIREWAEFEDRLNVWLEGLPKSEASDRIEQAAADLENLDKGELDVLLWEIDAIIKHREQVASETAVDAAIETVADSTRAETQKARKIAIDDARKAVTQALHRLSFTEPKQAVA